MTIQCSYCGKTLHVKPESAGKKGRCPACQQIIMIPRMDEDYSAPPAAPVSLDMEESINTDNAETAPPAAPVSLDTEESINTDNAEIVVSHDESDAEISSRKMASKLLKWLFIFGALFLLIFAVTIGGLMLYTALVK
ncbi:hypothetical protein U27_05784 [Candidatus Vecturithrix granuli]|uniref:Uncharacterized protein n=1 Tax=Vecturithrix granuli TaxID=1499967 RepID=A0A081C2K4_VECG1|nr:hypothetical protein U27_05784 [Candidatus Vecturithrix granuli]